MARVLPRAVSDHYQTQQRLIVATLGLSRSEWSAMRLDDIDSSWAKVGPRVNLLTASAQLGAARGGAAYVAATLAEYGDAIPPLAQVNPGAFAGIASDGRPLGSLLEGAKIRAKEAQSLAAGGKWLDMAIHTQIADAGRAAAATAIAVRPGVGWVRMVNPPCCGPCEVLAGREYRYSQGFQRHPRCDCIHVPTTLANPGSHDGVDPTFDQITDLTEGERKALMEGADLSRVVNARRGGGLGKMSTTELATNGRARLTPDGIFAQAKGRDEALALLKSHGYITSTARRVASAPAVPVVAAPTRPAIRFGKALTAPDGVAKPLKGHAPGRPLTVEEWEQAPSHKADYDFRLISDPDERATGVLQYDTYTERWAKTAAANIKAGRDPFDGISDATLDSEYLHYQRILDKRNFPDGTGYEMGDLRADLEGTARKLIEWESRTEDLGGAFKGVNFDADLSWDDVLARLNMRGLNYTSVASERYTASMYAGRADRCRSVVLEFEDARGIRLDSVGAHASKTESLVSGDYEMVGYRIEADPDGYGERMFVQVRRAT